MRKILHFLSCWMLLLALPGYAQVDLSSIANLKYSSVYAVKANNQSKLVYESTASYQVRGGTVEQGNNITKMSFVNFDLAQTGMTTVEITLPKDASNYEFRPKSATVTSVASGNTLTLTLEQAQKLVLKEKTSWNNVLCIFANPYHIKPDRNSVTYYFDTSKLHDYYTGPPVTNPSDPTKDIQNKAQVEEIVLKEGETVYIEEGAVVRARFKMPNNVSAKIYGRGLIAYGLGHNEDFNVVGGNEGAKRVEVDGVTICDAPGWIIRIFGNKDHLVNNVKMVGMWHFNTDGIQIGADNSVIKDCFMQCNDDNFSFSGAGKNMSVHNNILWNIFNGGVFNFGWGNPKYTDCNFYDNIVLRSGDCCGVDPSNPTPEVERRKGVFTMISYAGEQLNRINFKNIIIEEIVGRGQWIHFIPLSVGSGTVQNLSFENITVLQADTTWGILKGSPSGGGINGVSFKNLTINGNAISSASQAGLVLKNATNVTFSGGGPVTLPNAPTTLAATAISPSQINLSWTDNSTNEDGFKIERALTATGPWTEIETVGPNMTTYASPGLQAVTTYYYRVRSFNSAGASAYTNTANATTLQATPPPPQEGNLLINPGFENGVTGWTGYFTTITPVGDPVKSGTGAVRIARPSRYKGVQQDITALLQSKGPGKYELSAYIRALSGTLNAYAIIRVVDSVGTKYYAGNGATADSSAWKLSAGTPTINWTGSVKSAFFYIETNTVGNTDYFVDECTLKKVVEATAPAAPGNLTATAVSSTRINLSWTDNSTNETGFKVERLSNAGSWSEIASTGANVTTYADTALLAATPYVYRVRAFNANGLSAYSNFASDTTDAAAPAAPSDLAAMGVSTSQINLQWTDNSTHETGFRIERSTTGTGDWTLLAMVGANVTTYANTGLTVSNQYFYRVQAYTATASSAYSNTASAITLGTPQRVNILQNTGFESGTSYWSSPNGAALNSVSTPVNLGKKSLQITTGNEGGGVWQDITTALKLNGSGVYEISSFLRASSGMVPVTVGVRLTDATGVRYLSLTTASVSSAAWTRAIGTVALRWTGLLQSAYFYVESSMPNASFFADDCLMKKTFASLPAQNLVPGSLAAEPLNVYPVPAQSVLHIQGLQTDAPIQLYTMQGSVITLPKGLTTIDVSALPSGIYTLASGKRTVTFVKE